jgi:hypothetical protein
MESKLAIGISSQQNYRATLRDQGIADAIDPQG